MNESRTLIHTRPMAGAALGAVLAAILGSLAPDWALLCVCAGLVPIAAFLFKRRSAFFLLPLMAFAVLIRIVLLPTALAEDSWLSVFLGNLRGGLLRNADALFRDETAAARGILLGDHSVMEAAERAEYARSGLLHLFAVSGLHVTVLVGMLGKLIRTGKQGRFVHAAVALSAVSLRGHGLHGVRAARCIRVDRTAAHGDARAQGRYAVRVLLCACLDAAL
jgi:hypothetical protein